MFLFKVRPPIKNKAIPRNNNPGAEMSHRNIFAIPLTEIRLKPKTHKIIPMVFLLMVIEKQILLITNENCAKKVTKRKVNQKHK